MLLWSITHPGSPLLVYWLPSLVLHRLQLTRWKNWDEAQEGRVQQLTSLPKKEWIWTKPWTNGWGFAFECFHCFFFGEGWVETDSGSTSLCQNLDVFGLLLRGRLLRVYNWKHTCSDAKFVILIRFVLLYSFEYRCGISSTNVRVCQLSYSLIFRMCQCFVLTGLKPKAQRFWSFQFLHRKTTSIQVAIGGVGSLNAARMGKTAGAPGLNQVI